MGTKGRARFFFGPSMWLTRRRLTKLLFWHSMKAFTRMWSLYSRYRRKVCNTARPWVSEALQQLGEGAERGGAQKGSPSCMLETDMGLRGREAGADSWGCGTGRPAESQQSINLHPYQREGHPRESQAAGDKGRLCTPRLCLWIQARGNQLRTTSDTTRFLSPRPAH